jgi:PAS domain-containing protein
VANAASDPIVQSTLLGDALLQASPIAAFLMDDERHYVAVNDAAAKLMGYTREELLGRPAAVLDGTSGRAKLPHKDGSEVSVEYRVAVTKLSGMPLLLGLAWPLDDA